MLATLDGALGRAAVAEGVLRSAAYAVGIIYYRPALPLQAWAEDNQFPEPWQAAPIEEKRESRSWVAPFQTTADAPPPADRRNASLPPAASVSSLRIRSSSDNRHKDPVSMGSRLGDSWSGIGNDSRC